LWHLLLFIVQLVWSIIISTQPLYGKRKAKKVRKRRKHSIHQYNLFPLPTVILLTTLTATKSHPIPSRNSGGGRPCMIKALLYSVIAKYCYCWSCISLDFSSQSKTVQTTKKKNPNTHHGFDLLYRTLKVRI
jgi:hypothetical protein